MAIPITLKPRMSEKAYALSKERNTYVFDIPSNANKMAVIESIEKQFKVTVETVNIANVKGKSKRSYRRGGRAIVGKQSDVKKAYVRLKAEDHIPVFAAVEAEDKAEAAPAKATKEKK